MLNLDPGSAAVEAARDLQQAAEVAAHHAIRTRLLERGQLAVQHPGRNFGVLHRKKTAEPAAFLRVTNCNWLDAMYRRQQPERLLADAESAQEVTRRMERYPRMQFAAGIARSSLGEKLAELATPCRHPQRPLSFGGVVSKELQVLMHQHGAGLFSMLAHLSALDVAEGEQIDRGALVGRVGATGRVTGAHLHWAVRLNDARVDPLSLLAVLGTQ